MFECIVCYEDCDDDIKRCCPVCNTDICVNCTKEHIKNTEGKPKCFNPNCNAEWDRVVCINMTNLNFYKKKNSQKCI